MSRWFHRTPPLFAQIALACTLLGAAGLAGYFLFVTPPLHPLSVRNGPVTFLSFVLPDDIVLSPWTRRIAAGLFVVFGPLWWFRRLLPLSPLLCVGGFLALVAGYIELATQVTHVAHLTALLLLVHLVWTLALTGDIRRAQAAGQFWQTPLYPHWAKWLGIYAIGVFYGFSGWLKFRHCGPGWANGLSMQLWVSLWGDPRSRWTELILQQRIVSQLLQAATLVAECTAPLAIVWPRVRPVIGLALIGFHIGAILVFEWGFHANAVLIALYLLPAEPFVLRWGQTRPKPSG